MAVTTRSQRKQRLEAARELMGQLPKRRNRRSENRDTLKAKRRPFSGENALLREWPRKALLFDKPFDTIDDRHFAGLHDDRWMFTGDKGTSSIACAGREFAHAE